MIKIESFNILNKSMYRAKYSPSEDLPEILKIPYDNLALFIDPSTTSLGLVIASIDHRTPLCTVGATRVTGSTKEIFVRVFGTLLDKILKENDIRYIMVEDQYIDMKKIDAYAGLKLSMSEISYILEINDKKFEKVKPSVWKEPVLDLYPYPVDRRNSNKEEIRAVMLSLYPNFINVRVIDCFDALGIMYYYFKMVMVNAKNRVDLCSMMYSIANQVDLDKYEEMAKSINTMQVPDKIIAFNDLAYNGVNLDIVKLTKGSNKTYNRKYEIYIQKVTIKNGNEFINIMYNVLKYIKNNFGNRGCSYIIQDNSLSLENNSKMFIEKRNGKIGLLVTKVNMYNITEVFKGRKELGRLEENDYLICIIC